MTAVSLAQDLADGITKRQLKGPASLKDQGAQVLVTLVDSQDIAVGRVGAERLTRLVRVAATTEIDPEAFIADPFDLGGGLGLIGDLQSVCNQMRDPIGRCA